MAKIYHNKADYVISGAHISLPRPGDTTKSV
jgi:hypothetical protein